MNAARIIRFCFVVVLIIEEHKPIFIENSNNYCKIRPPHFHKLIVTINLVVQLLTVTVILSPVWSIIINCDYVLVMLFLFTFADF